jgi:plasmid stabilization system protein ParE
MAHRVSVEAESEFDGIWYYIASESGSAEIADSFVYSLTDRFFLIATNPYIGRRRDSDLRPGLWSFPVDEYVIVYRIDGEDVLILHVVRGSRDLPALLGLNL